MSQEHLQTDRPPSSAVARPVEDSAEVRRIAEVIGRGGHFALDLEFVSQSRYVPELCLVQVAWGERDDPEVAALDALAVDLAPVYELVEDTAVEVVLHSAQGDLALLGHRFGVTARRVFDTQIAAGFLGLGDQLGYAALVQAMTGIELDKGHQFTDWCRRPLSDEQLRYALDDVRYLPAIARDLGARLAAIGRLEWVEAESAAIAAAAVERTPPEEMFRRLGGWHRLPDRSRAALRALAAWREREALLRNKPPRWLLKDDALVEIARRLPASLAELRRIPQVPDAAARRHGRDLLAAAAEGAAAAPPEAGRRPSRLPSRMRSWGSDLLAVIHERCRGADIAPRFVASRADADALVEWWADGGAVGAPEPNLPLLAGWRRELAGVAALTWLAERSASAPAERAPARPAPADPGRD
ncbi:MAG TPA: HRDC domain-containing protein [Thermoanaerobaculia bacterium]|nr:HRDC domain-containing protein [Thermoanaerobaculia bacterium]